MDTTNIAIPKKEIAPGVFSTGGTATIPSNSPAANVISPESLKPVPTTNVPTFKPEIPSVEGDVAYYNQLLNQQTDNQKQLETARNQGLGEVSKLVQELTGQGNEQLALEQQFVNPAQQQLQGLTGQIGTQLAEYRGLATAYDKQSADIEAGAGRKGLTTGAVMGQQGAIERAKSARLNEKASEISLLQAEAQAVQGKVELAQKQVDRAIDLKYQSKQQEIEARKFQLASISDMLTKEEKRQAAAINMSLKKEEDRIGRLSEFQKTALNNAISNRAPSAILDKISRATSIEDITKVGSGYLKSESDKLDEALKRAQINKINIETSQIGVEGQKPPTEAQITNAGYAQRIAQANKIIDANTGTLKNLGWTEFQLIQSNSPLANKLLSTEKQQAAQAIKNFITAKLRKESGASIAPSEFDDARSIYFPIPGDSLEVIAQKKQTRDEVLSNSIQASGDAYKANEADTYLDNVSSALNQGTSVGDYLQSLNLKK